MRGPVVAMMALRGDEAMVLRAAFPTAVEIQGLLDPTWETADAVVFGGSDADLRWVADEYPRLRRVRIADPDEDPDDKGCAHQVVLRPVFGEDLAKAVFLACGCDAAAAAISAPAVAAGSLGSDAQIEEELSETGAIFFDDDDVLGSDEAIEEELSETGAIFFDDDDVLGSDEAIEEELSETGAIFFDDDDDVLGSDEAIEEELSETGAIFFDDDDDVLGSDEAIEEELSETGAIFFDDDDDLGSDAEVEEELEASGAIFFDDDDNDAGTDPEVEEPEAPVRSLEVPVEEVAALLGKLPSLPRTYVALCAEMEKSSCSMRSIARVVERDVAVAGQVLTVVNSPLYNLPRRVASLAEAAGLLGMQQLKDLVLAVEVFDRSSAGPPLPGISLDSLQTRAHARASLARGLAPRAMADAAYTVGLLTELGRMMLVAHAPDRYIACCYLLMADLGLDEAEIEVFGVHSRSLGAHLLAHWGLPDDVVEAVGQAGEPGAASVAGVVALADCFLDEAIHERDEEQPAREVTDAMLEPMGLEGRLELARSLARTLVEGIGELPARKAG